MSAVICDYVQVREPNGSIGDGNATWEQSFRTAGRTAVGVAFLIFNVRGLVHATQNVPVKINEKPVGQIYPYSLPNGTPNTNNEQHWFTQIIAFSSDILENGDNTLEIESVPFPGFTGSNARDNFELKDIICFFHQTV